MRDAMLTREVTKSTPVRFTWGPNVQGEIEQGLDGSTDSVYYGRIVATCDLYIFGFNCRVL